MNRPTVLITGTLNNIGRTTALAFAQAGNNVMVSGCDEEKGESLVTELRGFKIEADYIFADVRNEEDVRNMVDWTNFRFGSLDVAVNIAGAEAKLGAIVEQTVKNFKAVFEINVLGMFLSLKHELRVMLKQRSGVIINTSSILDEPGGAGAGIYVASKCAAEALTKAAAFEAAAANVRVNTISPGIIDTDILNYFTDFHEAESVLVDDVPLKRFRKPEEVMQIILFLASKKASITREK